LGWRQANPLAPLNLISDQALRLLENCPEQSLIVLEEPETSLHEYAQYEFAKYLMEVVHRRHHQVIMSSHSGIMMDALPPEARKLLVRSDAGVNVFDNVSSIRIRTALSAGERGHTILCVEDIFAQSFLREILRRFDLQLLGCVEILPFGDVKAVKSAKKVIREAGKDAFAVLDADQNPDPSQGVFVLPGSKPPEREVFDSPAARSKLLNDYGFDFIAFESAYPGFDHHKIAEHIAGKQNCSREVLEADCIRAFLDHEGEGWYESLCQQLRVAIL
jgi:energy-coupling factor transporter ATP-binding protein EcfA2